jgi:hypothetical protein
VRALTPNATISTTQGNMVEALKTAREELSPLTLAHGHMVESLKATMGSIAAPLGPEQLRVERTELAARLHSALAVSSPPYNTTKVALGFFTARQKRVLERWTNPKRPRRTRSLRCGVPSCRGKSAGVAKRSPRSPTRNP